MTILSTVNDYSKAAEMIDDEEILAAVERDLEFLDIMYGEYRNLRNGGFVAIISNADDKKQLRDKYLLDVEHDKPETIMNRDKYFLATFVVGTKGAVTVVLKK